MRLRWVVALLAAPVAGGRARCADAPWAWCDDGGSLRGAAAAASATTGGDGGGDGSAHEALLAPSAASAGANASAVAGDVLAEAGEPAANVTSHFVAFRCAESRGYLRTVPHPVLGTTVGIAASPESLLPPREAVWHLTQSASGLSVFEALDGGLLTMNGKGSKPPWMLFVVPPASAMDATTTSTDMTFRIEVDAASMRDDREKRAAGRVFSTAAGAYVNCVGGKHLRGHGTKPLNERPAQREPSTLLEIWTLSPAQAARAAPAPDDRADGARAASKPAAKTGKGLFRKAAKERRAKKKFAEDEAGGEPAPKNCDRACPGDAAAGGDGFPPVAFRSPVADFLCPSAFRDAADWVFAWPWSHFAERSWVASSRAAAKCAADVPLVYAHANRLERAAAWAARDLKRPFILISGQSDFSASKYKKVLKNDYLLRWYAQNADVTHPKLVPLPIGLNCFEQGPEMQAAVHALRAASHRAGAHGGRDLGGRPKRLWVNFGNTHARRKVAWDHFCGDPKSATKKAKDWATCVVKREKNNVRGNPHLVKYYEKVATHKYVAAPRGNGLDTHRFWEALYLGCVPVVERGPLDALYASVGALVVKSWRDVTPALLDGAYAAHARAVANATALLSAGHWRRRIEADRAAARARAAAAETRTRCWGPQTK